jgi:hypothetical protein
MPLETTTLTRDLWLGKTLRGMTQDELKEDYKSWLLEKGESAVKINSKVSFLPNQLKLTLKNNSLNKLKVRPKVALPSRREGPRIMTPGGEIRAKVWENIYLKSK